MMKKLTASLLLAATLAPVAGFAQDDAHPADKPLVVGSDFGLAPWMVRGVDGPEGFGYDMITEIAERIGRPSVEITDINFSGLFAALLSGRIEFTVNPLNITAERAETMLYSEPFFATGNGFITREGESMAAFEDLEGKAVAVNRGTISDTWATENAETYGFEVQRYDTFPDSVQAVITSRAFAAINEIPTAAYAAGQNPAITLAMEDYDGRMFGYAFRYESEAYRDTVEGAIECMKADGTLKGLYEKWYGGDVAEDSPLVTVYPGYGAPGFKGYDETEHELTCG
ncbi:substrate-binding periplasmic protein [Alloyangia pacifica]|uniref:substrate-binding periplasmic protein n=1 Tax=Alloyangia pacifica TaxID=311180 RepID=UPI001CD5534C|nr:transporter substrate-binding domain-containing protein [Alloyangia pacifica]MCA0998084.1 transporter substrate-binding domain-containing protein [Alloyangia pacifica]